MHVLLVVLSGFPARHVSPRVTPTLWDLAMAGGWAPDGGEAVMTSARYPNCVTLVTGVTPNRHRVLANGVPWAVGPPPTLFDACRDAGRSTAAATADPHLINLIGRHADIRWAGTSDSDVVDTLVTLLDDPPDLVFTQLTGASDAGHFLGPDTSVARDAYRQTDALLALVVDALRRRWQDWVVIAVSDHDVESTTSADPIDLEAQMGRRGLRLTVVPEGGAALVIGTDNQQGRWLAETPGVAGTIELTSDLRLVWARPGRLFGPADMTVPLGTHGGPGTTAQLAIVGGGHPAASAIGSVLGRRTPRAPDWAVTIADVLDLDLPTATGRSLVSGQAQVISR